MEVGSLRSVIWDKTDTYKPVAIFSIISNFPEAIRITVSGNTVQSRKPKIYFYFVSSIGLELILSRRSWMWAEIVLNFI